MSDLNNCTFIGRLGNDPDIKYLPSGDAVANLSIAVGSQWKDKQTGEKREKTEWVKVSFFGRMAEVCGEYLHKGSQIYVSGEMQTRKWTDKEGNDRYTTEIRGRVMQMLGGKSDGQQRPAQQQQTQPAAQPEPEFDDDIPF